MMQGQVQQSGQKFERVGVLGAAEYAFVREVLRGVGEVGLRQGFGVELINSNYPVRHTQIRVDGLVYAMGDAEQLQTVLAWGIPTVSVSGRLVGVQFPQVLPDNVKVGALAAEHVLGQGAKSFGAVQIKGVPFFVERCRGYEQVLTAAKRSMELLVLETDNVSRIVPWLAGMAKPVALFVPSDQLVVRVLHALGEANLRVPADVMVVGVDNDCPLCQITSPPLTSVDPDFDEVGRQAAVMLARWLETGVRPASITRVAPRGLIARQSSRGTQTGDAFVDELMVAIRKGVPTGITIKQLVAQYGVTRRMIEKRFAAAGAPSPAHVIARMQVERACQLLVDTQLSLDEVAEASGLGTQRLLRAVFRRHVGESPTAYRQRYRKA